MPRPVGQRQISASADSGRTWVGIGAGGPRAWTFVNNAVARFHTRWPRRRGSQDVWRQSHRETSRIDCAAIQPLGQQSPPSRSPTNPRLPSVDPCAQRLRIAARLSAAAATRIVAIAVAFWVLGGDRCAGQLVDSLDSYPPRWRLDDSAAGVSLLSHQNVPSGGHDDGGYESLTVAAPLEDAILIYPIRPARVLDDLTANLRVRGPSSGARIGLRVRYPYLSDPITGRVLTRVIDGAEYRDATRWQRIGIGLVTREVRRATMAVRAEWGRDADVRDVTIDAITVRIPATPPPGGEPSAAGAAWTNHRRR